jgi:tetratricopeptide (TPR) repeat protein
LISIGNCHLDLSDYSSALDYFSRALAIAEQISAKYIVASSLIGIGTVHVYTGKYSGALDIYVHALTIAEEIDAKKNIANIFGDMGVVYTHLADFPRALDFFSRSIVLNQEMGHKENVATLINIAHVFFELCDYLRTLDYETRALVLVEEIDEKDLIATLLGNMGATSIALEDYPRALEYLQRALKLSEQIGERRQMVTWKYDFAMVERKLGNLESAFQGILDTLNYRRNILKSNEDVAGTLVDLASILLEQGKPKEAFLYLEEALPLAEELGEKKYSAQAHKEISEAYSQIGDITGAFEHLKKHLILDKEIFSEESKKKIETFNIRVAIAEKEHETEIQKLKARHLEEEMKRQQEELSNKALLLVQQTDMLQNLRHDLDGIVRHADTAEKAVRSIREKLKEIPEHLLNWEKFIEDFRKVHPDFEKNLKKKYTSLSKAEIKVSCLLRIGMSTREIGTLLFLSERTVEIHRQHIRKKLAIKKGVDVHTILSGL